MAIGIIIDKFAEASQIAQLIRLIQYNSFSKDSSQYAINLVM